MRGWSVKPTVNGLLYLTATLALFLCAVNYGSNLLFLLCFLQMSVMFSCFWSGLANTKDVSSEHSRVESCHLGQFLSFELFVSEKGSRCHRGLSILGQTFDDLESGKTEHWELKVKPSKRGLRQSESINIESSWPLNLFRFKRHFATLPEVVIYPRVASDSFVTSGIKQDISHVQSQTNELEGVREYQSGDNANRIDWRAMARREQLQIKLFDGGEGEQSPWVDWGYFANLSYEHRISALCQLAQQYYKQGKEFGFRIPGFGLAPDHSRKHYVSCLSQLALLPIEKSSTSTHSEKGGAHAA